MLESLATIILEKSVEKGTAVLSNALDRKNNELIKNHEKRKKKEKDAQAPTLLSATFTATKNTLVDALRQHVEEVDKWCQAVRFSDLRTAKSVTQIYVELDTYLMPLNVHENKEEKNQTDPLLKAIKNSADHCAILGTAGAGKTTSIQKICADYFSHGKVLQKYNLPILIKLRNLNASQSEEPIPTALKNTLAISISINSDHSLEDVEFISAIERKILYTHLDYLNAVILLDGFDELATEELKQAAIRDISLLIDALKSSKIIVTSRSADFRYTLAQVQKFEIASLTKDQIRSFAEKWLQDEAKANRFLEKVFESPFADTAIRPLTVAHLCAIYERIQDIPEKPKSVYKRVVRLLLEDWDSQRSIKRPSLYANFDHDRKADFLAHLAFFMTTEMRELRFSDDSLKFAYSKIHRDHGLPENEAIKVAAELESHSGLIIESGRGYYEFAHKSIQEYLAADYIVRLPTLDSVEKHCALLANELAIATALSSIPCIFLAELFLKYVDLDRNSEAWIQTYLSRLVVEKPDLHVGATEYSAIASMHILTRLSDPLIASEILKGTFPANVEGKIGDFYQLAGRDSVDTRFRRTAVSRKYRLPDYLNVPTVLLNNSCA